MMHVAIDAVKRGFRAIPLAPNSKIPALKNWTDEAFTDAFDVYEQWPKGNSNVGIVTGDGIVVLDVDVKNGTDGRASLRDMPPLPATFTVRTPSGGLHYYFRTDREFGNSASKLAPGIDVRGRGGQVVAPGSVIDGKRYEIEKDVPLAELPSWLAERFSASPARDVAAGTVIGDLDTPEAINLARAMLAKAAPAIEGQGGNSHTFATACKVLDFGLSNDTAFEIMQDWNDRCEPPWDDEELERIIANARAYRQEAIGRDNPLAGMEAVEAPPVPPNPFGALCVDLGMDEAAEAALPPRPWLVRGLLLHGYSSLLIAPGGSGKSTFSLNLAAAVALGNGSLVGMEVVERTRVLIVNAEDDIDEQNRRTRAMLRQFGIPFADLRGKVVTYSAHGAGAQPFTAAERDASKRPVETRAVSDLIDFARVGRFGLIIVDPLVKTHRLNENDNVEMDFVTTIYSRIARETGAAILLLHHTKKPSGAGADGFEGDANAGRGASAIKDAGRVARTLFQMTGKEAARLGVPESERRFYSRLDDAKGNYAAMRADARWFRTHSVTLLNGDDAPAMVPVEFKHAEADMKRRREIVRRLADAEAAGRAMAAPTRGKDNAGGILADALKVDSAIIKADIEALKSSGDIRKFEDGKGVWRLGITETGKAWE